MSVSDEMYADLEKERKARRLETVQEVTRQIVADYLRQSDTSILSEEFKKSGDDEEKRLSKKRFGL